MDSRPGTFQVTKTHGSHQFLLHALLQNPLTCVIGDYPVRDSHPLVYASLLNHANYFLEQPTRMPGYIEERGRPVRQQWFVVHEVNFADPQTLFHTDCQTDIPPPANLQGSRDGQVL